MNLPLVSIITPSYNSSKFIEETIASVQAQTYIHLEMLITDDGSTDHSLEIIKEISNNDPRVKYFSINNSGPAIARNNSIMTPSTSSQPKLLVNLNFMST